MQHQHHNGCKHISSRHILLTAVAVIYCSTSIETVAEAPSYAQISPKNNYFSKFSSKAGGHEPQTPHKVTLALVGKQIVHDLNRLKNILKKL